jgi:hypothetical protein
MIMPAQCPSLLPQSFRLALFNLRKSRFLGCLPLQPMHMLSGLTHRILRHKQRAIGVALSGLGLA